MKCLSSIWSTGSSHTENHRPVTRRGSCCSLEGDTPPQLPTFALLILPWSAGLSSRGTPWEAPPRPPDQTQRPFPVLLLRPHRLSTAAPGHPAGPS